MQMEITMLDRIARVRLNGRLDTPGVDLIETKFNAAVVPEGYSTVIDLSQVNFIASMGLRMFIAVGKALKRKNARIVLFAPQSQVNEIFQTVQLRDIIPVVVDEAEA